MLRLPLMHSRPDRRLPHSVHSQSQNCLVTIACTPYDIGCHLFPMIAQRKAPTDEFASCVTVNETSRPTYIAGNWYCAAVHCKYNSSYVCLEGCMVIDYLVALYWEHAWTILATINSAPLFGWTLKRHAETSSHHDSWQVNGCCARGWPDRCSCLHTDSTPLQPCLQGLCCAPIL